MVDTHRIYINRINNNIKYIGRQTMKTGKVNTESARWRRNLTLRNNVEYDKALKDLKVFREGKHIDCSNISKDQRYAVQRLVDVLEENKNLLIDPEQTVYDFAIQLKRSCIKNARSFK